MSTSSYRHYRAPRGEGEVLCDPAWSELAGVVQRNRQISVANGVAISSSDLQSWSAQAREQLLGMAFNYSVRYRDHLPSIDRAAPIVMAGHQPQMFHPGVWFK